MAARISLTSCARLASETNVPGQIAPCSSALDSALGRRSTRSLSSSKAFGETWTWSDRRFQLTAPQDGMLVVKLSWDAYYWDTLLLLRIEDTNVPSGPASFSPIIGRAPVAAGRTYYLAVGFLAVRHAPITDFTLSTVVD